VTGRTEWLRSTRSGVDYPPAPWQLTGSLWLSVFHLARPVDGLRPAGLYAAAFVSYEEGGSLTYRELMVARPVSGRGGRRAGRRVTVTDIWVDSPASRAGGRELWAIPKDLCDFEVEARHTGPVSTTGWTARLGRTPIASARFRDLSRVAPRTPFRARTWQPGLEDTDGQERTAGLRGSARTLPARAHWDINPVGPLGWLLEARQLGSLRQASFRMRFG